MEQQVRVNSQKLTTQEEQLKTAFKRLSKLEDQNKESLEQIQENQREILKMKTEFKSFTTLITEQNKSQTLEIQKLFEQALSANSKKDSDREKKLLQDQNDKKDKYIFWIVTSALGTFITYAILAFLSD